MFVQDIYLNATWQKLEDLVEIDGSTYSMTNCSNDVIYIAEADSTPTEGALPVSPCATFKYTKGSQSLYLRGCINNRVAIYSGDSIEL